jgi:hypothetical protein
MGRLVRKCLYLLLLFSVLIGTVKAADQSFAYQFLGSPLLALVVLIAIDAIAFIYHRIRR